jgi:AcrR family transcriptional regulator
MNERSFILARLVMPSSSAIVASAPRGERTRQTILDAAEQLFMAHGYNGTSMRQIAQQAGDIAVGGIYNHFANKKQIFRALLEARSPYPELIQTLDSLQGGTGPELLAQAFTRIQALIREHLSFIQLVAIDLQEFDGQTILSLASEVLPHALQFFTRVQAAGGIRQDISIYILARSFAGELVGFALTDAFIFRSDTPRLALFPSISRTDWQTAVLDVFMNGIASGRNGVKE